MRSALLRFWTVTLFVLAAGSGPAWELAHAFAHVHAPEDAHHVVPAIPAGVGEVGHDHGHDHPTFAPVAPLCAKLSAIGLALPTAAVHLGIGPSNVRVTPTRVIEARAGPQPDLPSQPRAPPLL